METVSRYRKQYCVAGGTPFNSMSQNSSILCGGKIVPFQSKMLSARGNQSCLADSPNSIVFCEERRESPAFPKDRQHSRSAGSGLGVAAPVCVGSALPKDGNRVRGFPRKAATNP